MGNQTPCLSPSGNHLLPALQKRFPPRLWLTGAGKPLQHLLRPRVPSLGGRGMCGLRGGRCSSAEALGAAAWSTEQMERESGSH